MADYRERDHEIYQFICCFLVDNGYSPTQAEIKQGCELEHKRYVYESLQRLEKGGFIWIEQGKIRNIRVVDEEVNFVATRSENGDSEIGMLEEILRDLYTRKKFRVREI